MTYGIKSAPFKAATLEPGKPAHMQLTSILAMQIRTQELAPGSKLPTVRDLAGEYGLNRNTAQKVYASLKRMGLIVTRVGDGSYVRTVPGSGKPNLPEDGMAALTSALQIFLDAGMQVPDILAVSEKAARDLVASRETKQAQFFESRRHLATHPPYRYLKK